MHQYWRIICVSAQFQVINEIANGSYLLTYFEWIEKGEYNERFFSRE
jgi:hypothetical protein